jgi:predicted nucleic acid-binding protein
VKRLSVYLDTSVVSFLFADDEPELRDITQQFFDDHLGKYDVAVSEVLLFEIGNTQDEARRQQLREAVDRYAIPVIQLSPEEQGEVFALAEQYVEGGIVPASKREDALHLAIATVLEYDVLLSWNFRHLANLRKQIQVRADNERAGYLHPLSLLNPMELMHEED